MKTILILIFTIFSSEAQAKTVDLVSCELVGNEKQIHTGWGKQYATQSNDSEKLNVTVDTDCDQPFTPCENGFYGEVMFGVRDNKMPITVYGYISKDRKKPSGIRVQITDTLTGIKTTGDGEKSTSVTYSYSTLGKSGFINVRCHLRKHSF